MLTTIIDYGAGNLRSVQNTLDELSAEYIVTNERDVVDRAVKLVLPGVGHFGQMISALDALDLRQSILGRIRAGIPFLGICLGLQALFERSEESPDQKGLGVFAGDVLRFTGNVRIPHMGWNSLEPTRPGRLLEGLPPESYAYFAHSFYAPAGSYTAITSTYVQPFTAAIEQDNVFGVQFHPEKSGPVGLRIVRNFVEL